MGVPMPSSVNFLPRAWAVPAVLLLASVARAQQGDVTRVHDPAVIAAGNRYYVFSTGRGVPIRESDDLFNWRLAGRVFDEPPAWAQKEFPKSRGQWAPDIHFVPASGN